jgi:hypothetical protein
MFCSDLERSLEQTFAGNGGEHAGANAGPGEAALAGRAAIAALTGKLFAQDIISAWQERERAAKEQLAKEKKTEGKK